MQHILVASWRRILYSGATILKQLLTILTEVFMNLSPARRKGVQLFISAAAFSILGLLACSGSSEQTEMSENTTRELQAKIVYYAMPG